MDGSWPNLPELLTSSFMTILNRFIFAWIVIYNQTGPLSKWANCNQVKMFLAHFKLAQIALLTTLD